MGAFNGFDRKREGVNSETGFELPDPELVYGSDN